jgi:hypothetical protein
MRKCCGYFCSMIAIVAIFFYTVIIVMEKRHNNFLMYKMQYPEGEKADVYKNSTSADVRKAMEEEADHKVTALIIAIVLNVLCVIGCMVQVKFLEKKERLMNLNHQRDDYLHENENYEESKEN